MTPASRRLHGYNQSVQPTLDGAPPLLVVSAWDGLVRGSCVAHTVHGSCVAHTHPSCWVPMSCPVGWVGAWLMRGYTHPSCWVPVSVPQDKSPRSQELNRQVPSRRFIKRCPVPHDKDTAYRLYSVDGESIQALALHPNGVNADQGQFWR
jgi:hypothetical protein